MAVTLDAEFCMSTAEEEEMDEMVWRYARLGLFVKRRTLPDSADKVATEKRFRQYISRDMTLSGIYFYVVGLTFSRSVSASSL